MYVNAPIALEQVAHLQETMQAHGATIRKIRRGDASDHWYTVFLPEGTIQEETQPQREVPLYTVRFPDGYCFQYEAGKLDRRGVFTRDPVIFVDQ